MSSQRTPGQLGYRMPPEWAPHQATWMVWPTNRDTWADIPAIETCFRALIRELLTGEHVHLLVDDSTEAARIVDLLHLPSEEAAELTLHQVPTADVWIRDYGPNFLVHPENGRLAYNDWHFNAWGNKYEDLCRDDQVSRALGLPIESFHPDLVLEGGAIEVNGEGLCLTTESCLLSEQRNPGLSRLAMERILSDYLGVSNTIWLTAQIPGDDTDGHIDQVARFVDPETVACPVVNSSEGNWTTENLERLEKAGLKTLSLPVPSLDIEEDGPLPASYANFYIANEKVLVPSFGVAEDSAALEGIQTAFSDRKVIGLDSRALIRGLGAVHCITQQQPKPQPRLKAQSDSELSP